MIFYNILVIIMVLLSGTYIALLRHKLKVYMFITCIFIPFLHVSAAMAHYESTSISTPCIPAFNRVEGYRSVAVLMNSSFTHIWIFGISEMFE